jgi:hypothetical protein
MPKCAIFLIAFLLGGPLFGALSAQASETVPFSLKGERQQALPRGKSHAWRVGERVQAPFTASSCEAELSLLVAEAKGGVGDIRHADRFLIKDTDPKFTSMAKDWRGMTFEGVVEIIAPSYENGIIISNMQEYTARIVSLSPPASPINPDRRELRALSNGTEVTLIGSVDKLDEKWLTIKTPKASYKVELWSGVPVLESDLSGFIENLSGKERLEAGDEVRLKVYVNEGGELATHWCRTCALENPSRARKQSYDEQRLRAKVAIAEMQRHLAKRDWPGFRKAYADLVKQKVTATEGEVQMTLANQVPEAERPLLIPRTDRYTIEALNLMFAADFDQMTRSELMTFCRSWARREKPGRPEVGREPRDESYLYDLIHRVGLPKEAVAEIARLSVRARLTFFKNELARGLTDWPKQNWREYYNLGRSLEFIGFSRSVTPGNITFLVDVLAELAELEFKRPSQGFELINYAVKGLRSLFEFSVDQRNSVEGAVGRTSFAVLAPSIRALYDELLRFERTGKRGEVIVIGAPEMRDDGRPFESKKFKTELSTLYRILEIAETWAQ